MRTTTDLRDQLHEFATDVGDLDPDGLLARVEQSLEGERRRRRRSWVAAACAVVLVAGGLVLVDRFRDDVSDPEPAVPDSSELVLTETGDYMDVLPEYTQGLRRIGVAELPSSEAVRVRLPDAGEGSYLYAALGCDWETAQRHPAVRMSVGAEAFDVMCEPPRGPASAMPIRVPGGEGALEVGGGRTAEMQLAVYEEVSYEEYPDDAPIQLRGWHGDTADTGTTLYLHPRARGPIAPATWEWEVTVGEGSALELWPQARGRWRVSVDGMPLDAQRDGTGWRGGWWVHWGDNQSPWFEVSPDALAALGVAAPESGTVTVRVVSEDVSPDDWFLVLHGRGDAMPVTDSDLFPATLDGAELLAVVEVHPNVRDALIPLGAPLAAADLRLVAMCPHADPDDAAQPVDVLGPAGAAVNLNCEAGELGELLDPWPGDDRALEELRVSGVVTEEQSRGEANLNLNNFQVHVAVYRDGNAP